jgi:predicted O-methyltransferase YrrM
LPLSGALKVKYQTEIAQDATEIDAFAQLLRNEGALSYLEIGSKFGGSLWRVANSLPPGSRIVSVDLPSGTKAWNESSESLKACIKELQHRGYDAHMIWGDSTAPDVVDAARELGTFDAILIDADHRLPGVTADWNNYRLMGEIIAFHDIGWKRAPDWVGTRIDVPDLWDKIKGDYRHREFKYCPTGKNNGIGVLWRCFSADT